MVCQRPPDPLTQDPAQTAQPFFRQKRALQTPNCPAAVPERTWPVRHLAVTGAVAPGPRPARSRRQEREGETLAWTPPLPALND
ncbi:hypothetical protein VULLAG_LOCUS14917 [Vulpes lagopus]